MDFVLIPDPNSGLKQWYATDNIGGFHVLIRECDDKTGFVGRIIDAFTGENIQKVIGSKMEIVADKCHDHINKMIVKGFVTSL